MTKRPLGVNTVQDMWPSYVHTSMPDGRYVRAVAAHYHTNPLERIRVAWWILTGRAHAVVWPKPGDLEKCFPDIQKRLGDLNAKP